MKKTLLYISLFFISLGAFAQNGSRERMKAHKVAYITEQLNLTSQEAQQFWPIYNAHEETVQKLKMQERKMIKDLKQTNNGTDGLSDQQAGDFLATYLDTQEQKSKSRKKLILDLQKILPNKKIIKLIKAKSDFNKRILDRIRERRKRH